jgi:hypothetical protein
MSTKIIKYRGIPLEVYDEEFLKTVHHRVRRQ